MSDLVVKAVASRKERSQFFNFPWQLYRNDPQWPDELALIARRNWSDTAASEPTDLGLLNASGAELFDPESVPREVDELIASAGLEPGVDLPPLP